MYTIKRSLQYALIFSIVIPGHITQAELSLANQVYSRWNMWWNRQDQITVSWLKYAFLGGLSLVALVALWPKRVPQRPSRSNAELPKAESSYVLKDVLQKLDPTLHAVYFLLFNMNRNNEEGYIFLCDSLMDDFILSNYSYDPLSIACSLVWFPEKEYLVDFFVKHSEDTVIGVYVKSLFESTLNLSNYLTSRQIASIKIPSSFTSLYQERFIKGTKLLFLSKLSSGEGEFLKRTSYCIKSTIEKLQLDSPQESFKDLLAMQTRQDIIKNIKDLEENESQSLCIKGLIQEIVKICSDDTL